ncbi:MAG: tRNA pseudouridine(55) synthase TruB [Acidobacteria bacterium]|nr:tRNA pseudouridine(55) synthase TruB [Acidobacteriota bacterium]
MKKKTKNNLFSKKFVGSEASGALIIDKPAGLTSNDVLNRLKRLMGRTKMGHGGTLDPFATGVLPVFLNRATRLARFFLHADKVYEGTVHFGWATDTYDCDGRPQGSPQTPEFSAAQLAAWVERFQGNIRQTPPAFSSLKWRGRPLYSYARHGVAAPIPERSVSVHHFEIRQWSPPCMDFVIHCSSGTYIRSIAHDLGQLAGCGAHLCALRRLRSGPFALSSALSLATVEEDPDRLAEALLPPEVLFPEMICLTCGEDTARRIKNGSDVVAPLNPPPAEGEMVKLLASDGSLLAMGKIVGMTPAGAIIHPVVVL